MRLAVIGLGKLGSPFAALLAAKGNDVVGADLNARFCELINRGEPPVDETGLAELLAATAGRLRATTDVEEAAASADVVFVVVPTPSLADASFDTSYAEAAFRSIGAGFRRDRSRRRVAVLTSTLLPGGTEGPVRAALEDGLGEAVGDRVGLCYSPEFIALGSVIADMRDPDLILVGESAPWAGELVGGVLQAMTDNGAEVRRMAIVDAEVTKIAVNTFVTTKISYANMLAEICERLPGADASVVAATVGLDSRIGRAYLRPAAAYGGPCFPRDNAALAALARRVGTTADIAEATDAVNRRQASELARKVAAATRPGDVVGVLGLSYKPGTGVAEKSYGVAVAAALAAVGLAVVAHDPVANPAARHGLDEAGARAVALVDSAADVLERCDVLVLATAWPAFADLGPAIAESSRIHDVFDCWRQLGPAAPGRTAGPRVWLPGVAEGAVAAPESA